MERRSLGRRLGGGAALGAAEGALFWSCFRVAAGSGHLNVNGWAIPFWTWTERQPWPVLLLLFVVAGVSLGISAVLLRALLRMDPDDLGDQALRWTVGVFRTHALAVTIVLFVLAVTAMLGVAGTCVGFIVVFLGAIAAPLLILRREALERPAANFATDVAGPGCGPIVIAVVLMTAASMVSKGVDWVGDHSFAAIAVPLSLAWSLVSWFVPLVAAMLLVDARTDVAEAAKEIRSWRVLSGWIVLSTRGTVWLQLPLLALITLVIDLQGGLGANEFTSVFGAFMVVFGLFVGGVYLAVGRFIVLAFPRGVQSIPTDLEPASTDVQPISTDVQSTSTDVQSTLTEVQSTSTEVQSTLTDVQSTSTEVESISTEVQSAPTDVQSTPPDVH